MDLGYIGTIVLLILGFGFVVFWHELGHFLAAKWAGVKVEQFAIGFGHAICSWRKGLGLRWGSSGKEYEQRVREIVLRRREAESRGGEQENLTPAQYERAALELGLGETEYRLNWLPLGGYVKMLGQDDMRPGLAVDDPRSYTNKPIGQRMVIVSAGVVMNVILAAILFMALFLYGFRAPPPVIGTVQVGSPAQYTSREDGTRAPLQVGDTILYFDGKFQHDFTKITLAVALAGPGRTLMYVERADGTRERLLVTPVPAAGEVTGIVMLGVSPSPILRGIDPKKLTDEDKQELNGKPVQPGETIVAINGQPVEVEEYYKLDRAVQESFGKPVPITVRDASGAEHVREIQPEFYATFGNQPLTFAGLVPRTVVSLVQANSSAKDKLQAGDVILKVTVAPQGDSIVYPTSPALRDLLKKAGENKRNVDMTVLRDGQELSVTNLSPDRKLEQGVRGIGIGLDVDVAYPVVADVMEGSAAAGAGISRGSTIVSMAGQDVQSWHDIHRILSKHEGGPVPVRFKTAQGEERTASLTLDADEKFFVQNIRYYPPVLLAELQRPRKTDNPLVAAWWGVTETRDLIIQFYLTLQRMAQGRVSPTNLMGPFGIVHAGSRIAYKGTDWLMWFLAMISANLAVVNFLPIPIVDGGLFLFLVLEKLMGRPLSQRAQSIAQIVGLALILSVFLFVTYQDINRIF